MMSGEQPGGRHGAMKTANLTLLFVSMDGFAERMARFSYREQAALAAIFEAITVPVARKLGGRKVKTVQDSMLFAFASPTAALKASAAMQDRADRYSGTTGEDLAVRLRIGASSGEVRVFGGDVYGEPVNLAARVKGLAGAGEVLLTGGVHLSMNRAEIGTERVGRRSFKGVPEQVEVHRLACSPGCEDSYGGEILDNLGLPTLDERDALALASGRISWLLHRVERALAGKMRPAGARAAKKVLGPRASVEATGLSTPAASSWSPASAPSAGAFSAFRPLPRAHGRVLAASVGALLLSLAIILGGRWISAVAGSAQPLTSAEAAAVLPELERQVAAAPADHSARLALAQALSATGSREAAIAHYQRVVEADPGALDRVHVEDLAGLLSVLGEATGMAQSALLAVGRRARGPLMEIWEDDEASRYHRRRAGQVLVAMGREVDLVPLWIQTLDSEICAARELAARELQAMGDERALPHLERASTRGCLRGRTAARQALEAMESP